MFHAMYSIGGMLCMDLILLSIGSTDIIDVRGQLYHIDTLILHEFEYICF